METQVVLTKPYLCTNSKEKMKFHDIKVKSVKSLTPDSVRIDFDIPAELKSDYSFTAGQYLTIDKDGVRRDYSLCTSPLDDKWSVGVKEAPDGYVSHYLNRELKAGDTLRVSTPNGRFGIPTKPDEKRTIIALAAGSGITPIMSILKYTLQTEKWVNFYLFYSNRTPQDIMFQEELKQLEEEYPTNFHTHHFFTRHEVGDWLFEGRLDAHKFELITNQLVDLDEVDEVLVCGPNDMITTLTEAISDAGIYKKRIHFEMFTPMESNEEEDLVEDDSLSQVEVTVELDGEVTTITWDTEKNLVDAMVDEGLDAPYSCKGGICSSCMCKLEEGEVELKENFVLTDADEEEGIILACCSRPKSKEIRINFDDI